VRPLDKLRQAGVAPTSDKHQVTRKEVHRTLDFVGSSILVTRNLRKCSLPEKAPRKSEQTRCQSGSHPKETNEYNRTNADRGGSGAAVDVVEELESVVAANLQRATRLRQSIFAESFHRRIKYKVIYEDSKNHPMAGFAFSVLSAHAQQWSPTIAPVANWVSICIFCRWLKVGGGGEW